MKGRRKVKTLKWQMHAQFEAEAEAFALAGIESSIKSCLCGLLARPAGLPNL